MAKQKKKWIVIAPLVVEGETVGSLTREVLAHTKSEARGEAKRDFVEAGMLTRKARLPVGTTVEVM